MLADSPVHGEKLPGRGRFPSERTANLPTTGAVQVSGLAGRVAPDTSEFAQQEHDAPPGASDAQRRRRGNQGVQQAPGRLELQRRTEVGRDDGREGLLRWQDAQRDVARTSCRWQKGLSLRQSIDQGGGSDVQLVGLRGEVRREAKGTFDDFQVCGCLISGGKIDDLTCEKSGIDIHYFFFYIYKGLIYFAVFL